MFVELYDAADQVHDLSGCQVLLDVLQSRYRLPVLDQDLLDLRHDLSAYLGARNLWSTDYYQSAPYVSRPALEQALEDLLRGRGGRILQLHAADGMGKSMQLRWFIARRCVPAPHRIPCVRIDLDVVASAATWHPWLLLVEMAAQLDPQLPYGPFQDLLVSYSPYRTLLAPAATAPGSLEIPVSAVEVDGADIQARFTDILVEKIGERPVVMAFDSMEHLLRPGGEPTGVLELVGRLNRDVGSLRIILVSQDDLRGRLPGLSEHLPGLRSVEVGPLGREEQRRYLSQTRHLPDPELVDAVTRHSGGMPSQLNLLADLVEKQPGIDPNEIGELEGHNLAERLLEGVADLRLRWVLRFGVVPRRLTFQFFAEVLAPFMTPEPPPDEISKLWRLLVKYASASVWVSVVLDDQETIRYHPAVAPALRELLREHSLSAQLHQAAARWFEELSRQRPGAWGPLVSEAVYHSFQVDTASGVAAWHQAIGKARRTGRPDWILPLAEDLLNGGNRDEAEAARRGLPPQTLAEAYLERARALAELALERQAPGDHPLWRDAEDSLRAATAVAQSAPGVWLPEPSTSVLRSRMLLARGRAEDAEKSLRDQPAAVRPSPAAAELERALGDALWRLGRSDSADHYRQSYQLAAAADDKPGARLAALGLARQLIDQRRVDQALDWLTRASGNSDLGGADEQVMLARADALSLTGMPVRAEKELRELGSGHPRESVVLATKRASLLLAAFQPVLAVDACSEILRRLTREPGGSADVTAEVLAIRGNAYSALLEFESATCDLMSAMTRARDLRDLDGAAQHAARLASLQLSDMGDLRGAAQAVDEAERVMSEPASLGWIAARVAQAQLLDRAGGPSAARELFDSTWPVLEQRRAGPVAWLRTAVGGLTLPPSPGDARCLRELVERLNLLEPLAVRLRELQGLHAAATRADIDPRLSEAFVDAAVPGWRDGGRVSSPEPAEQALLGLIAAEALRLAGRGQEARALLDDAVALRPDDLLWWRWLQAQERIGPARQDSPVPPEELELAASYPVLGAAYLITLAQHRLGVDGHERAAERLDRAAKLLLRRQERTNRWMARLLEVQAQIASSHGQHEAAGRSAAGAVHTWSKLGDDTRLEKLGRDYALGSLSRDLDVGTLELRFSRFVAGGPFASVTATLPDESADAPAESSLAVLGDIAAGATSDRLRSAVDRILEQWDAWALAAGQRFQEHAGVAVGDAPNRATWDAIRAQAANWPRRPLRVLVLRPGRKRELGRSRGVAAGGYDFARIYRRHHAEMWVLKNPTPAQLRDFGQQFHSEPPEHRPRLRYGRAAERGHRARPGRRRLRPRALQGRGAGRPALGERAGGVARRAGPRPLRAGRSPRRRRRAYAQGNRPRAAGTQQPGPSAPAARACRRHHRDRPGCGRRPGRVLRAPRRQPGRRKRRGHSSQAPARSEAARR